MLGNAQEYAQRRQRLIKGIGPGSVAIIAAAQECLRNGDAHYPYRQNSDFYYLTGLNEPEAVAVFIPGRAEGEFILFNRERNPEMEIWVGPRAGQEGACKIYGADQSFAIEQLDEKMPQFLENHPRLYYAIGRDVGFNRRVLSWVATVQSKVRAGVNAPAEFYNIEKIVHEMRLRKTAAELDLMRTAAEISAQAHKRAMQVCRPGMMEYELEAELQYYFTRKASRSPAYSHIVGAGANSCVLHYNDNDKQIADGDLVLIDAGAEYKNYAADITRTFPANGRFSTEQKIVYEIVLATQLGVIAAIKPGILWAKLEEIATEIITQGLLDCGLLKGDFAELLSTRAFRQFYMHRIGHWLGLDVHDAGNYKTEDGQSRLLEPGMVFTVEPGIYIAADNPGVDKKWWNIGIRIEDDVLVTENGCEVLSRSAPKTIAEIEECMANAKQ